MGKSPNPGSKRPHLDHMASTGTKIAHVGHGLNEVEAPYMHIACCTRWKDDQHQVNPLF